MNRKGKRIRFPPSSGEGLGHSLKDQLIRGPLGLRDGWMPPAGSLGDVAVAQKTGTKMEP